MKRIFILSVLFFFMTSAVFGSELINDRIEFSSFIGYIAEKFIVPSEKNCMVRLETSSMDKNGIYAIAIAKIPETEPVGDPEIIFQETKELPADSGIIQIEMDQIPVIPGEDLMLTTMYMTENLESFSIPVKSGGIEIGHNDIYDLSSLPPPISEPGYTAFTIYYGCESGECINSQPQFTKGNDILAKAGKIYEINNWATNIIPGLSDCEKDQNLTFVVTSNIATAFIQNPQIDPITGDLRFETASNVQENISVSVALKDDGGTENNGNDISDVENFKISVVIPGNIDGLDQVTLKDAVVAMQIITNIPTNDIVLDAEINNDRRIGLEDLIYILRTVSETY